MAYIGNKPANKAVVASDLDPAVITGQTALAVAPADTDEFLISDAGTLKRIDASLVGGGGITGADHFRLSANLTSNADPISSNLERVDDASFGKIGTGMSVSSGIFSFPETGLWQVSYSFNMYANTADNHVINMQVTTNNSSYADVYYASAGVTGTSGAGNQASSSGVANVNVTNVSNVKVKFKAYSITHGYIMGATDNTNTGFYFLRIGDSV